VGALSRDIVRRASRVPSSPLPPEGAMFYPDPAAARPSVVVGRVPSLRVEECERVGAASVVDVEAETNNDVASGAIGIQHVETIGMVFHTR